MPEAPIDHKALRVAHAACFILALVFSLFSLGLLALIITMAIAREVRTGYLLCTTASSLSLWVVFALMHRARYPHSPHRRSARP